MFVQNSFFIKAIFGGLKFSSKKIFLKDINNLYNKYKKKQHTELSRSDLFIIERSVYELLKKGFGLIIFLFAYSAFSSQHNDIKSVQETLHNNSLLIKESNFRLDIFSGKLSEQERLIKDLDTSLRKTNESSNQLNLKLASFITDNERQNEDIEAIKETLCKKGLVDKNSKIKCDKNKEDDRGESSESSEE